MIQQPKLVLLSDHMLESEFGHDVIEAAQEFNTELNLGMDIK